MGLLRKIIGAFGGAGQPAPARPEWIDSCACGAAVFRDGGPLDGGGECGECWRERNGLQSGECARCGYGVVSSAHELICSECAGEQPEPVLLSAQHVAQAGICALCHRRPARPEKYKCADCAAGRGFAPSPDDECLRLLAQWRARRADRKAAGQCLHCGERLPAPERDICATCAPHDLSSIFDEIGAENQAEQRAAAAVRQAERRAERERRRAAGLCTKCGERPARPKRAQCAECSGRAKAST